MRKDYFDFLRIPSISADPAHAKDMQRCAKWVESYMQGCDLEVEMWETPTYPVVFGQNLHAPGKPTLLIYGHYDVQPVDPIEEWQSDPFEPTEKNGQIYARGAQDNKGQILYALSALRHFAGKFPLNIKVLIEGEEENKSPGLHAILDAHQKDLKADYLVSPDFDIFAMDKPLVTLGLRGMVAMTVELTGSRTDLHSGMAGGVVYNPLHALTTMLASLRDEKGRITVKGFYDDVQEKIDPALTLETDWKGYEKEFQTKTNGGEAGYTPGQSGKVRPTLEINGISGGYAGPGFKTVIPAKAMAKVSCRLVPHQNPQKIMQAIEAHLKARCPEGMRIDITPHGGDPAIASRADTPLAQALAKAYTDVTGHPCLFSVSGGSVPITSALAETAGAIPAFYGYGLPTDQIHAPNEHFGMDRMELGRETTIKFLENLGGTHA